MIPGNAVTFVELCAGLMSVSLSLVGAPPPPISRFGSKVGYAVPILREMGLSPGQGCKNLVLVEADNTLCRVLDTLTRPTSALAASIIIKDLSTAPAESLWRAIRNGYCDEVIPDEIRWLLVSAGARGGIGGFKGKHKLRPHVDGFIPNRISLSERLRSFSAHKFPTVTIMSCNAMDIQPIPGSFVYIDPPYVGTTGYGPTLDENDVSTLANEWARVASVVCVSEAKPLSLGCSWRHVNLTSCRTGQRRTMSRTTSEWLTIHGDVEGA